MHSKYGKLFPILAFATPICITLFQSLFLFLWMRGWFSRLYELSPALPYAGIGLSVFFGLCGVAGIIAFFVIFIRHYNDKDPIEEIKNELKKLNQSLAKPSMSTKTKGK